VLMPTDLALAAVPTEGSGATLLDGPQHPPLLGARPVAVKELRPTLPYHIGHLVRWPQPVAPARR
jgi:hypothetical protein